VSAAKSSVGAPARQTLAFMAEAPGASDLVLDYSRPWEKGKPAARQYMLQVTVDDGTNSTASSVVIDGSVPDDEPEAEEWLHQIEKHRDPSHHRLLSPGAWTRLCEASGLRAQSAELKTFKQPDLEWYFETAATSPENRQVVRGLIANASATEARTSEAAGAEIRIAGVVTDHNAISRLAPALLSRGEWRLSP